MYYVNLALSFYTAVHFPAKVHLRGDPWQYWQGLLFCPDVAEWSAYPLDAPPDTSPEPAGYTQKSDVFKWLQL